MTLAISTSSPWASVALIAHGSVTWDARRECPQRAGSAVLEMLKAATESAVFSWQEVARLAVDVGPGSFTGVRVGVAMAKTFAWIENKPVVVASSFDLITSSGPVVVPSKKGEWWLREPGANPVRVPEVPSEAEGYGPDVLDPRYPDAAGFALLGDLPEMDARHVLPLYLAEPSISIPRKSRVLPSQEEAR